MKKGNIKRDCPEKKGIDEKKVSGNKTRRVVTNICLHFHLVQSFHRFSNFGFNMLLSKDT